MNQPSFRRSTIKILSISRKSFGVIWPKMSAAPLKRSHEDEMATEEETKKLKEDDSLPTSFGKKAHTNERSYIKKRSITESLNDTEYIFENGMRKVKPYYFKYCTYAKGRWIGMTLRDLYKTEFKLYTMGYQDIAIRSGRIKINHKRVESLNTRLQQNDVLTNEIHRHECPVTDEPIKIIVDDDRFLVVNKPSSIPIHPCGRFKFNTLLYILAKEHDIHNLYSFNRIDRLTSGLIIFGKNKKICRKLTNELKQNKIQKEYLCRVVGIFPEEEVRCCAKIKKIDHAIGIHAASEDEDAKDCETIFQRVWTRNNTSVVRCRPITGRTHQIRVHLQYLGFPIMNDPLYNNWAWGDERFTHGYYTKPADEIISMLMNARKAQCLEDNPTFQQIQEALKRQETESARVNEIVTKNAQKYITNEPELPKQLKNPEFDDTCHECIEGLPDPKPHELNMWLHAFKYTGPDWEFTAPIPSWAKEPDDGENIKSIDNTNESEK